MLILPTFPHHIPMLLFGTIYIKRDPFFFSDSNLEVKKILSTIKTFHQHLLQFLIDHSQYLFLFGLSQHTESTT